MSVTVDQMLNRLLHYGSELPAYEAGSWKSSNTTVVYQTGQLTSLEAIMAEERGYDIISNVLEANKNGYIAHPEALLFVLAVCAKKGTTLELRQAAYNAVEKLYGPTKLFFTFVKFSSDLSQPATGWGRAHRRTVSNWYLHKDPLELARTVTQHIGLNGWAHKDIFKLAHTHSKDPAQNAVLNYVVSGMRKTVKAFGHKPEAENVINFLRDVEAIRHSKDATSVSLLISRNSFSFEYVPSPLHRDRDIWSAVIPLMPLLTLLKSLKRLSRYRLLRRRSPIVPIVVQRLCDSDALAKQSLLPTEILLYTKKYEASARLRFVDRTRPIKPPPPANSAISDALSALLNSSISLLKPNGLRTLIAINNGYDMQLAKCWQCRELTCCWASMLIAHCILKKESDTTFVVFSGTDMEEVNLDRNVSFNEMLTIMRGRCSAAKINMALPIKWAERHTKAVDVFIVVSNSNNEPGNVTVPAALKQYRTVMNLPGTKYIGIGLESNGVSCVDRSDPDPGILEIKGFDVKVPVVIEAFSRGFC